jgi:tetratricopeptide (TPR) repeat protein
VAEIAKPCRVLLWGLVFLLFAHGPWIKAQQQPATASGALQTNEASVNEKEQLHLAQATYLHGDYEGALRVLGDILRRSPEDSDALTLQGLSYLKLENYPAAIKSFQDALKVRPGDAYDVAGLLSAYSLSGKSSEAAVQRKKLQEIQAGGNLPAKLSFVIDRFQVGDQHVEVTEFFPYTPDQFHYRYSFLVRETGHPAYRIALESDDADQTFLADSNPQKAAAMAAGGKRRYSLDKYAPNTHATFKLYDGEPAYEQVRDDAKQAIAGTLRPMISQQRATAGVSSPASAGQASPSQPSTADSK